MKSRLQVRNVEALLLVLIRVSMHGLLKKHWLTWDTLVRIIRGVKAPSQRPLGPLRPWSLYYSLALVLPGCPHMPSPADAF